MSVIESALQRIDTESLANTARSFSPFRFLYFGSTLLIFAVLIGGPIIFYLWGSVWSKPPGLGGHFTLEGYARIFQPAVYTTIKSTILVAIAGTAAAMAIGIGALLVTIKTNIPGRRWIRIIVIVQYLLPSFILAIGWDFYLGETGFVNQWLMLLPFIDEPVFTVYSLWGIAIVGGVHWAGLVYLLSSAAVGATPYSFEEAAKMSGASNWDITKKIVLPLALPSLAISAVLVFTRLSSTFGLPLILGIPARIFVVSTHMYVALSNYPPSFAFASALGMIVLIASLMGLVIQRYITGNRRKYETISGSESTETMRFNLKKYRWPIMLVAFGTLLALYVIPYLIIFLFSFQSGYGVSAQITFANYERLLVGPLANSFYESYFNTLIVSGVGAFMAMTLSSMASYIIVKSQSNFGQVLDFVAMAPLAIPSIIIATAFLWFFLTYNVLGLFGTIWILILAMSVKLLVYGTRATNSAFNSVGTELEEIAELSGANFFQILRRVYIPLIKPGFFAGFLILFIDYTKMLTIPLFLSSADNSVMSTMIYNVGIQSNEQYGAALSVILSATLIALYLFAEFVLDIDVTRL